MKVKFSEVLFFIGMIAIMLGNLFMITEYPFVYPGIATILKLIRYLGYMDTHTLNTIKIINNTVFIISSK